MNRSSEPVWHALTASEVCRALDTDAVSGLDSRRAEARLRRHGPNVIGDDRRDSLGTLFIRQLQDALVLVLLGAAALSVALGEWHDAIAIVIIVVLNAIIGVVQEYRAERSLQMLQKLAAPRALVVRDGRPRPLDTEFVVPGDVVLLEAGNRVPADCRIVESTGLEADESPLTGESVPVGKDENWQGTEDTPLGDRHNMLYLGTAVTRGRARAVVVATGMATEVGRIAHLLEQSEQPMTPLQRRLAQLGRSLALLSLAVVLIVFFAGLWNGVPLYHMFLTAVSLAVAAIPEGLPAAVTVSLALGVQRMARRRAIVRRLPAVETLGCATVICSDKTGTLTTNEMVVTSVWLAGSGRTVDVVQDGLPDAMSFSMGGRIVDPRRNRELGRILAAAALCNHAQLDAEASGPFRSGQQRPVGDPTEIAMLAAAKAAGIDGQALAREHPLLAEWSFDSERRMMSVLCRGSWDDAGHGLGNEGGARSSNGGASAKSSAWAAVLSKGAVEAVLARSSFISGPDGPVPLGEDGKKAIVAQSERLASRGLRVLAVAWRPLETGSLTHGTNRFHPSWESRLTFGGLIAMYDPPRPEVKRALSVARRAGVRTIMLTGDHPATARFIAEAIGLSRPEDPVITGQMMDRMGDEQLEKTLAKASVFARVSPAHKLRIVKALQRRGEVIAMTGDGVNDAPAIKEADIGIAMGRTGSDVAREAADMVLADDNFATIVAAIEEGRGIYANIRKFIRYLLTCNMGEILTMFLAVLAGLPLPLLPMQILLMNIVTDGLPAMGLGVEKTEPGAMLKPPRPRNEHFFAGGLHWRIVYRGMIIGLTGVAAFAFALMVLDLPLETARTLTFTTLVLAQLAFSFQCRSETVPLRELGLFTNRSLVAAVVISAAAHAAVVHGPWLQGVFGTTALSAGQWALAAGFVAAGSVLDGQLRRARGQIARARPMG